MIEYIFCRAEINNVPNSRTTHGYMVARRNEDGNLWYYGVYSLKESAEEVAKEIGNGIVLEV